jgi:hypothetical protein
VPDDVWRLLDAERLASRGVMPVSGGFLEQTLKFLQGIEYVRRITPRREE